ncbi:unnamed protein product [Nesidiocoris tenuis]|uniref:Uncharacterized protein n=1 Tax=Nesidiocoris tenuis TaxID=355587 RepID=A0A6H5GFA3_9HEMI|nr:unnamed protein product [Nesidiocoris tenuis]
MERYQLSMEGYKEIHLDCMLMHQFQKNMVGWGKMTNFCVGKMAKGLGSRTQIDRISKKRRTFHRLELSPFTDGRMRIVLGFSSMVALLNVALGDIHHEYHNHSAHDRPEEFRIFEGGLITSYNFPWACVLFMNFKKIYDDAADAYVPVSSCSIFSDHWIVTSISNLHGKFRKKPYYYTFDRRQAIANKVAMVQAGADLAIYYDDNLVKHHDPDRTSQRVTAEDLFVVLKPEVVHFRNPPVIETPEQDFVDPLVTKNPTDLDGAHIYKLVLDTVAYAVDMVLVRTEDVFKWSQFILAFPVPSTNLIHLEVLSYMLVIQGDTTPSDRFTCGVHAWHPISLRLYYYDVVYIPKPNCQKTWCNFKSETCYSFPVRHHDFCFMSTSYFDICDFDNSAALFCPSFQNSIFGFAKKSSQCGANGIPSVYTSVSTLVRMCRVQDRRSAASRDRNVPAMPVQSRGPSDVFTEGLHQSGSVPRVGTAVARHATVLWEEIVMECVMKISAQKPAQCAVSDLTKSVFRFCVTSVDFLERTCQFNFLANRCNALPASDLRKRNLFVLLRNEANLRSSAGTRKLELSLPVKSEQC